MFADLAILTVGLLVMATIFRLGADRIFIGEVEAARETMGSAGAGKRGARLVAFSLLAGATGGTLVTTGPLAELLNTALSAPLSGLEAAMVGLWLASDIARLVIGEGHRARLHFRLAAFAGTGARAPLFLALILGLLAATDNLTRESLIIVSAAASSTVFSVSLLALGRYFPWWATNPLGGVRQFWFGHGSMLMTTVAATLIGAADIWIVGAFIGPESAARYAFAVTLVAGIAIVSTSVSLGLSPYIATGLGLQKVQATSALVVRYTRIAGTLAVAIYIGILVTAQPLAVWLGGNVYDGVFPLVALLGAGQLAGVLAGPGGTVLIVARQYQLITSMTVGVALLMLTLTTTAAWTSRNEILVAIASGSATALLHGVSALASKRKLGMTVQVFSRRPEGAPGIALSKAHNSAGKC